jgi:hypothetical protein
MADRFIRPEARGEKFAQRAIAQARKTLRAASERPNPNQMYLRGLERMIDYHRKERDR